jgi:hypothetical protein
MVFPRGLAALRVGRMPARAIRRMSCGNSVIAFPRGRAVLLLGQCHPTVEKVEGQPLAAKEVEIQKAIDTCTGRQGLTQRLDAPCRERRIQQPHVLNDAQSWVNANSFAQGASGCLTTSCARASDRRPDRCT